MFKNDQISAGIWKLLEVEFHLGLQGIFNEMIIFLEKKIMMSTPPSQLENIISSFYRFPSM